jgi:pimeloyl-ACP methyl ester carboxylesterase
MSRRANTIVLIHGLWMTPRSWELFRGFYEDRGYRVLAPAWPRIRGAVEDIRRNPSALNGLGIAEIAAHYEKIVRSQYEAPILMGHSFGGLIVQLLLDRGLGAAGVSIAGVPPRGVLRLPLSALKAASPVLWNPFNLMRTVGLTLEQFYFAFANAMTAEETCEAYERYAVPGPGHPIFEQAVSNLNPFAPNRVNRANKDRAPLLLIAGSEDHTVPPVLNLINQKKYARSGAITEYREFPRRSHLIIAQKGWQEVAEFALSWAERAAGGADSGLRLQDRSMAS